jgi:hypothetical protein
MTPRISHAAICVAAALALSVPVGCGGEDARPSGPTVEERVTGRFGHDLYSSRDDAPLTGRRTALAVLKQENDVQLGDGGFFIEAIGDRKLRANAAKHESTTWALNVNGIESDEDTEHPLHAGDEVQWDLRYWYVTLDVRATVGAFPETFTRGVFGKQFPTRVLCERPSASVCARVKRTLRAAGVRLGPKRPGMKLPPRGKPQRGTILVGKWRHWRDREWASRIDHGPRYSGVFARFSPDGRELRLNDWFAHHVRTEGAGTGLVAAMRPTEEDMMWVVTGVDDEGVDRAARALSSDTLRDAFAVAVTREGVVKLPLVPR